MIEVELIRMSFTYKLIFAICVNKIVVVLGKDKNNSRMNARVPFKIKIFLHKQLEKDCTCTLQFTLFSHTTR